MVDDCRHDDALRELSNIERDLQRLLDMPVVTTANAPYSATTCALNHAKRLRAYLTEEKTVPGTEEQGEQVKRGDATRHTRRALEETILNVYDQIRDALDEANKVQNVNYLRMSLTRAMENLHEQASELRKCPTCKQSAPHLREDL